MIRSIPKEQAEAFPFSNDAEAITFHKMRQLMRAPDALCLSDGQDVLFVRAGLGRPAWIYTRRGVPDETLSELAASLCVLKDAHNLAGVIGRSSLVRYLELALPFPTQRRLPLTAYLCEKPNVYTAEGARVHASKLDPVVCGDLLAQLGKQAREPIPEGERLAAGERFCQNPDAYGWCINGTTVSLTAVSHRVNGVAHVNSVVTDAAQRGHGYARALVTSVCADEFANGGRTMLYADTSYPVSNALYRAIGFAEVGRLIGFDFTE
jgi:predicted GNAT family acetyltransferase